MSISEAGAAALFFFEHAAAFLVLSATAYVAGWLAVRSLPGAGRLERAVLFTALGLAVLAQIGLFLGLAGWLKPLPVLVIAAGFHLAGLPAWRDLSFPLSREAGEGRGGGRLGLRILVAAIALAPFFLLSLYPPTGFDATLYHLPFAQAFVESGGVPFLPELRFPVFPQANDMCFALVMLFFDDTAAHGVELLANLLTAALVFVWGREAFGSWAGWGGAAIFLGNPIVAHLSGEAYVEPGLTLFTTAALFALWRWRMESRSHWLALAVAFASAAAATKYLGLFFLGVVGLVALIPPPPRPSPASRERELPPSRWVRGTLRRLLLVGAVALVVAGPWYARMVVWTGNPLFPFYTQAFGESLWSPLRFKSLTGLPSGQPLDSASDVALMLASRLGSLIRLPWDIVFERDQFGEQPPYSPVYLVALPLAALLAVRDRRLRPLLLVAAAYAFVCLALPRDSRYLMPALPLVSLAAGATLQWALQLRPLARRSRLAAVALCAACFLPSWGYGIYRIGRQGPVPVTVEQREAYLARRLPLYPAIAYLNRRYGEDYTVYGLWSEEMQYFARGRFLGDWFGPASYFQVAFNVHDAAAFHQNLRRTGAGFLLVATDRRSLPVPEDAAFSRLFDLVYADSHARLFQLKTPKG